jgi:hypothetical protein
MKIIMVKDEFRVSMTIHLGKNPKKGGRPPKESININIEIERVGELKEKFEEII